MSRVRKVAVSICLIVFVLPLIALLVSDIRWNYVNSPRGNFTNVTEYLAWGRPPMRVMRIEKEGSAFYVAYGPVDDTWLRFPSGPPGYVFDASGKLIDWSSDTGDDAGFQLEWRDRPHEEVSIEHLRRIGPQRAKD